MTLIDASAYDLKTVSGQGQAIDDLMGESNSQFDALSTASAFNVAAYTELSVTILLGQAAGTTTTSYTHGLGYPPLVIGYMLNPSNPSYSEFPLIEMNVTGLGKVVANSYFTVDNSNLYFSRTITSSVEIGTFVAAFYIFSIPLYPQ